MTQKLHEEKGMEERELVFETLKRLGVPIRTILIDYKDVAGNDFNNDIRMLDGRGDSDILLDIVAKLKADGYRLTGAHEIMSDHTPRELAALGKKDPWAAYRSVRMMYLSSEVLN